MFGTIRRHQTWLWAVIITLTVISFLVYFSPYSRTNSARRIAANFGSINGKRISQEEFLNAKREVILRYFLQTGSWWDEQSKQRYDPDVETYKWLLLIQKQDQMHIHVSTDSVADEAREMLAPFERAGMTSPAQFVTQFLVPKGIQYDDFERYVRHFVGLQELISAVALSGKLVTPQEATEVYQREHRDLATEAVFFSASNYLATVTAAPQAIAQYYSNNMANYRLPERVQVAYVRFSITNFLPHAEADLKTNLNEIVDANFQRIGTNYTRIAKTPEEAKAKIREDILRERAMPEALEKAREFVRPLVEKDKPQAADLDQAAKAAGLMVAVTEPFSLEEDPKEPDAGGDFAKEAFARTAADPIYGPIAGKDGAYVLALRTNIPSMNPPFEAVREKVTADYNLDQAKAAARKAGADFAKNLTNGIPTGKTFAALCAEAKVKPTELPPFSLTTRSVPAAEEHLSLEQLKNIAFSTAPGKVSPFQATLDGGVVLFVREKLPLDESKMKTELPGFITAVRQSRQNEAFNDWFKKEIDKGLRDTPLLQRQAPPANLNSRTAKS